MKANIHLRYTAITIEWYKGGEQVKVYSPSDVASLLELKTATLRKYSIMLEEQGYEIQRNSRNHRYYQDKDIMTLRNVITGTKNGITLEESINNVINLTGHNNKTNEINNGVIPYKADIEEIKELVHNQNELIKGLTERLDKQETYINESLKERDRLLIEFLDEMIENKKQIATEEHKNKKGFFGRLFRK